MKKIIVELNYDIEVMDNEVKAIELAEYHWNHMTDKEKEKADYFKVYEVEIGYDEDLDNIADFNDYMTRMIKNYKEVM